MDRLLELAKNDAPVGYEGTLEYSRNGARVVFIPCIDPSSAKPMYLVHMYLHDEPTDNKGEVLKRLVEN